MQPVRQLKLQAERTEAKRLGQKIQELKMAERQLAELYQYRHDYYQQSGQTGTSISAALLATYQQFLARLNSALERQNQTVTLRRQAVEQQRKKWLGAQSQLKALDNLIERFEQEEQLWQDKQEQKMLDDWVSRVRPEQDE
jgi:flagellar FliJ protein